MPLRLALIALASVALLATAGCDSGNAVDPPTAADVAGVYSVTQLRFVPDATALTPVNVLDTLVMADTYVELLDGGQATLRFRRTGGVTRLVAGSFAVRTQQVRVTFDAGNEATLAQLVLPNVITFDRSGGALSSSGALTADLTAYDPDRYAGFTSVPGRLTVALAPRVAAR